MSQSPLLHSLNHVPSAIVHGLSHAMHVATSTMLACIPSSLASLTMSFCSLSIY